MNLSLYIRDIPDFPKKGVVFKDITPLLKNKDAFQTSIDMLASIVRQKPSFSSIKYVLGIESRGFIFASALAFSLGIGFIPVRKKGKLPFKTQSVSYALEYGEDSVEIHQDAFKAGDHVLIVDDVLATGGTLEAVACLVERMQGNVDGVLCLMELVFLHGREKLKDYAVSSLVQY